METSWNELHRKAVAQALDFYQDPLTGFWVATELALKKQKVCCDSGCRHCPYPQRAPKRSDKKEKK